MGAISERVCAAPTRCVNAWVGIAPSSSTQSDDIGAPSSFCIFRGRYAHTVTSPKNAKHTGRLSRFPQLEGRIFFFQQMAFVHTWTNFPRALFFDGVYFSVYQFSSF